MNLEPTLVALARLLPGGSGIDAFEAADRLPWLIALLALALLFLLRRSPLATPWPALSALASAGGRRFDPQRLSALVLRAGALLLLALAVAEPAAREESLPEPGKGLDLVLVLDTSGSMRALDTTHLAQPGAGPRRTRTRLELAKEVVARFAVSRVEEGDRVGLVVFGESALTLCPLTSDGALLAAALDRADVGIAGEATALGDALALATKRVRGAGAPEDGAGQAIVLLTDGRSNAGSVPVGVAMELAAAAGVRVHTVGIGIGGQPVPMASEPGRPGAGLRFERHDPDLETLEQIAGTTRGRFHHALHSDDLARVYGEIDALERVARPLPAQIQTTPRDEPLLAAAGGLLLLELAVARVVRRPIP